MSQQHKNQTSSGPNTNILNQIQSLLQNYEQRDPARQADQSKPQPLLNNDQDLNMKANQLNAYVTENSGSIQNQEGQILIDQTQGVRPLTENLKTQKIDVQNQSQTPIHPTFQLKDSNIVNFQSIAAQMKPNAAQQLKQQCEQQEINQQNSTGQVNQNSIPVSSTRYDNMLSQPSAIKEIGPKQAQITQAQELNHQQTIENGNELLRQLQQGEIDFSQFISTFQTLLPIQHQNNQSGSKITIPQQKNINQEVLTKFDQNCQNLTQVDDNKNDIKDINQNQTHDSVQIINQNNSDQNQNQNNINMQSVPNFEVPSSIVTDKQSENRQQDKDKIESDKGRHALPNSRNQGTFHKMQSQTFFEDLFPQVNTIQKTRAQNQFQFINEMMIRNQRSQKPIQAQDKTGSNTQDMIQPANTNLRNGQPGVPSILESGKQPIHQRSGSSDVNQQNRMLQNINIQNQNEFHKFPRGIQSPFQIQKQSQSTNQVEQNKSKDSRQSKQSKQSKKSNSKQSRTSDGQHSSTLQRFQQDRPRKVFENDSQSHDENQVEQRSKGSFQGSAWKPFKKRDQASNLSNHASVHITDDQNPQQQSIGSNLNLSSQSLKNQSSGDLQNILMQLLIQKIKQEIQNNKANPNQQVGTDSNGQNTCFTDDKNIPGSIILNESQYVESQDHKSLLKNPAMIQRVEEQAADIQQLILNQLREKAQQLHMTQFYQEEQAQLRQSSQKNSQTRTEKNSEKDETAKFPVTSQISHQNNQPERESSNQQNTDDLNNTNKQIIECQNNETIQENQTSSVPQTIMSKDDKKTTSNDSLSKDNQAISQINLDNFPNLPEEIKTLIINKQNEAMQAKQKSEKQTINYNSGSGSGSGKATESKDDQSNGLDINQLHKLIENYIPPQTQSNEVQKNQLQNSVNLSTTQLLLQKNQQAQNARQPNQQQDHYPQESGVPAQETQRMRYNGPTSSSGSGEDQNRQQQNQQIQNLPITKQFSQSMTTGNLLSFQNDLKNMLTTLQGTQNKVSQIGQSNIYQNLLGKRSMKDRVDAHDSNLLQKQLSANQLNIIQQIQNVSTNQNTIQQQQTNVANGLVASQVAPNAFSSEIMKQDQGLESEQQRDVECKQDIIDENDDGLDDDTPMQIRLRNQIRNNQSKMQFRQVKIELLKAIRSEKDMSKTIIDAKPKRPHHNMGANMFRGSRYRGVSKNKNKWQMMIMINQKKVYIGAIQNEFDAARYYDHIAIISQGLSAKTNFKYSAAKIQAIISDYDIDSEENSRFENYPSGYNSISSNDNQLLQQINVFKNQRVHQDKANMQLIENKPSDSMFTPQPAGLNPNIELRGLVQNQFQQLLNLQQQQKVISQNNQQVFNTPQNYQQQSQMIGQNEQLQNLHMMIENQKSQMNTLSQIAPQRPHPQMQQQQNMNLYDNLNLLSKYNSLKTITQSEQSQNLIKILNQKNLTKNISSDSWQLIQNHARNFPAASNQFEMDQNMPQHHMEMNISGIAQDQNGIKQNNNINSQNQKNQNTDN